MGRKVVEHARLVNKWVTMRCTTQGTNNQVRYLLTASTNRIAKYMLLHCLHCNCSGHKIAHRAGSIGRPSRPVAPALLVLDSST